MAEGEKTVVPELTHDPWLSARLGRRVFGLAMEHAEDYRDPPSGDPFLVFAKAPAHQVKTVHGLEEAGFRLVDVLIELEKKMDPAGNPVLARESNRVRWARPEDEARVRSIAAENLISSRFHLDPVLDNALARNLKSEWAGNFFSGKRGQAMAVAVSGDVPIGFMLLVFSGPILEIDLIAVDSAFQRKGLGREMIGFAQFQLSGFDQWKTGTQAANGDAIRFYEALGFSFSKASYVLHRHGPSTGPDLRG